MSILLGDCSLSHLDMAPIIPSSANNVSFIPGVTFTTKRSNFLTRCSINRKFNKQTLPAQRYTVPLSTSMQLFPQFWIGCILKPKFRTQIASASGTDIAVEEANLSASDGEPSVAAVDGGEISGESSSKSDVSQVKSKRSRPVRKSEMPPVKNEDLIPGATFTGKVRSIQPFGAFVDFGAFTDGLVHVSRLSDSFVKDVASVVTVGQEVTVRLIEANMETGRISLSMRESDDPNKVQQQRDAPVSSDKSRPPRKTGHRVNQKKEDSKKTSKFVKGQGLEGTVKNLTRAGTFISLPEGEEGFLPTSEEADEGFGNIMGGSSLEIGQEVSVRVLRITRGQVTLTMKKEEDFRELDTKLSQGIVHTATNPFVLAFRSNQVISAFLDERENKNELVMKAGKDTETVVSTTDDTFSKTLDKEEDLETPSEDSKTNDVVASSVITGNGGSPLTKDEITQEPSPAETEENKEAELPGKLVNLSSETVEEASEKAVDDAILKDDLQSQKSDMEDSAIPQSDSDKSGNPLSATKNEGEPYLSGELTHQSLSDVQEVTPKAGGDDIIVKDVEAKENKVEDEMSGKVADPLSKNVELAKEVEVDDSVVKHEVENQKPDTAVSFVSEGGSDESGDPLSATENEGKPHLSGHLTDPTVADVVEEVTPKKMANDRASDVETKENKETEISGAELSSDIVEVSEARAISDAMVKDELQSHNADASIFSAPQSDSEVPEDPLPATGNVGEPHFAVELTDLTLYDKVEEVSPNTDNDMIAKDEDQCEKVDSAQPTVTQDEKVTVADKNNHIESSSARSDSLDLKTKFTESLINAEVGDNQGDNNVNEGEKQASAATSQNGTASDPSGQSNDSSTEETTTKAVVSPALVKQLREESGAGMMDCKRALSETGGDIVKAQEYLRKKGLASAEKKASRVTAEGRIGSYIHDSRIGVLIEVNCETDFVARGDIFRELVEDLAMQVAACPQAQYLNTEDVPKEIADKEREIEMQKEDLLSKPEQIRSKIVDGRIRKRLEELALLEQPFIKDDKIMVKDWVKQTISTIGENIKVKRFVRYNLGEGLEKKSQDFAAEVAAQTVAKPISTSVKQEPAASDTKEPVEESPKPVVSAAMVKQLREETGAGMMDCKKALSETGGDLQKAQEYLRKKGLSTADKKSSRLAAEGRIGSYIHDSRIGVIIEVNCETDFVARGQNFKELVNDLAMQVVACPQVLYVSIDDISEDIVNKEQQLEMQREDLQSKPENIREKIVKGRVTKRLGELTLLEQPFIRNDSMLVKDLVKQTVAALGENIKVRRFVRFTLGETSDAN